MSEELNQLIKRRKSRRKNYSTRQAEAGKRNLQKGRDRWLDRDKN
ncbi:hypothetical protein [Vibrio barjaei]|nr:hypothetical protein [Vibrio barjaei]MCY9870358.1 hypothetical protein [Vibrio barjaei]